MNTANLELCEELYKLSGWVVSDYVQDWNSNVPAYDAGFLLRKLPDDIHNHEHDFTTRLSMKKVGEGYFADYSNHAWWRDNKGKFTRKGYDTSESMAYMIKPVYSDNPEDCLCKLAIALYKEGVLK